jgi:hypothetical protein
MKLAVSASILASILLAQAGRASAQPGITEPAPAPAPAPVPAYGPPPVPAYAPPPEQRPAPQGSQLSEGTALALSLGGTIASYGLIYASIQMTDGEGGDNAGLLAAAGSLGAFFAPSFGHWYAGTFATRGLGLRAGGAVVALIGVSVALSQCPLFSGDECDDTEGALIGLAGIGMYVAGTVDDIVTAPRRVRERNARFSGIAVAPVVTGRSAGVAVGGRF